MPLAHGGVGAGRAVAFSWANAAPDRATKSTQLSRPIAQSRNLIGVGCVEYSGVASVRPRLSPRPPAVGAGVGASVPASERDRQSGVDERVVLDRSAGGRNIQKAIGNVDAPLQPAV